MKIEHVIQEAIEAPLYTLAKQDIEAKIQEWVPYWANLIDERIDNGAYTRTRQAILGQYEETGDIKFHHQAAEMQHQRYDVISKELMRAGQEKNDLYGHVIFNFKFMLEKVLQQTAMNYIQSKLSGLGDLSFLKQILVDLDYRAKSKSGKPKKAGGYYQHSPKSGEFSAGGDDMRGIKLYTTRDSLWEAACYILFHGIQREMFGEAEPDRELSALLSEILPTFTHEVVHLEQDLRKQFRGSAGGLGGLSYTPQDKKRPSIMRQTNNRGLYARFRGGKRGLPSRLGDMENIEWTEWVEYFGTDHEIEAHAAGAAAAMIHDIIRDTERSSYYQNNPQVAINNYVDGAIEDLQAGFLPNDHHSLRDYQNYIREQGYKLLRLRKWKDERALNKINIGARKVWKIFLTKVVKHLLAYKKTVIDPYQENPRNPNFRLPAPAKPPMLPG